MPSIVDTNNKFSFVKNLAKQCHWTDIFSNLLLRVSLISLIALVSIPAPVEAQSLLNQLAGKYAIRSDDVDAKFSVKVLAGKPITGTFNKVTGTFEIDKKSVQRSKINVAIDINTVSTGSTKVDQFLKGDGFFNAKSFPAATFASKSIQQTGPKTANVNGTLTIKEISRPITLKMELLQSSDTPKFKISGSFFRSKYGMDVGQPIYADLVRLNVIAKGRRR